MQQIRDYCLILVVFLITTTVLVVVGWVSGAAAPIQMVGKSFQKRDLENTQQNTIVEKLSGLSLLYFGGTRGEEGARRGVVLSEQVNEIIKQ